MKIKTLLSLFLVFLCVIIFSLTYVSNPDILSDFLRKDSTPSSEAFSNSTIEDISHVTEQASDKIENIDDTTIPTHTNPLEDTTYSSEEIADNSSKNTDELSIMEQPFVAPITLTKEDLSKLDAYSMVDKTTIDSIRTAFYSTPIPDSVRDRILGVSYVENSDISYEELRYIRLLHIDFQGNTRIGELIVNINIADDIVDIFYTLYKHEYPIEKMVLIDDYNGDDTLSMEDNNTSAFNYRTIPGSSNLSKHSLGLALDINPLYNPYIKTKDEITTILPPSSTLYVDRSIDNVYYIKEGDLSVELFKSYGFTWGGDWNSLKDYQHFEK